MSVRSYALILTCVLSAQNLAEERPSRWVEIFFYSHPSIAERLEAAQTWAQNSRAR